MAKLVGIDITENHVRAVLLRTSYRKVTIEAMGEIDRTSVTTLEQAVQAGALTLVRHGESIGAAIDGQNAFVHRLKLPPTALRQLEGVLPFEIEAQVPVDFDELVFDYRVLPRISSDQPVPVLTAAARLDHVRERIEQIDTAVGRAPERIGVGAMPLANLAALCPELAVHGPVAVVELGDTSTEVVILAGGYAVFARTISLGVAALPQSAAQLTAHLKQTLVAWTAADGDPVTAVYLAGSGAFTAGAESYFSSALGVATAPLPALKFDATSPEHLEYVPRFAKAIGIALGLRAGARDLDLRRGSLAFQRGFSFVKEKLPLLTGLGAALFLSFIFATWAEGRALAEQNGALAKTLTELSRDALGEAISDPEEVLALLDRGGSKAEKDPQPEIDGFDVAVSLAEVIPDDVVHDVDELDAQRGHVKLRGVVGSTDDAEKIAAAMKERDCYRDVKITKISQAPNSKRQKYSLEWDIKCDAPKDAKTKEEGAAKDGEQ